MRGLFFLIKWFFRIQSETHLILSFLKALMTLVGIKWIGQGGINSELKRYFAKLLNICF